MYFYSTTTGGFYRREIHGKSIPDDAVEISESEYAELMDGQSSGKQIIADQNGFPVLADQSAQSDEQLANIIRIERNTRLAASDWTQARDIPEALSALWAPYRAALRDITNQVGFPRSVNWPDQPREP